MKTVTLAATGVEVTPIAYAAAHGIGVLGGNRKRPPGCGTGLR
jgi:hypothetical protein